MKKIILSLLFIFISVLAFAQPQSVTTPSQMTQSPVILQPQAPQVQQPSSQIVPQAIAPQMPQPSIVQPPQPAQPLQITVFGEQLFTGRFAYEQFAGFNPDYQIAIGDKITVRIWGAYNYEATLTVDPRGNIFIPQVGPIMVLGVKNSELNQLIEREVNKVFKNIVGVYASLEASVPVKIFVTGFVRNPGLYGGLSSNSVLYYIDRAGGVDPDRGSFIDITVLRSGQIRKKINLYDFLLNGRLELIQMVDGDIIFVAPKKSSFSVSGEVFNPYQFEFEGNYIMANEAMNIAKPKPGATHVTITRKQGLERYTEYYALNAIKEVRIYNGDDISILSDRYPGTIIVRIEGAHSSPHAVVLPYGATMNEVLSKIVPNVRSNMQAVQLFRKSVAQRQKEMILSSIRQLQTYALTGRSETQEEAKLRATEAELILKFVEMAKNIEPKGQVTISSIENAKKTFLEDGDVINIPEKTSVVMVHGEVRFPNAIIYMPGKDIEYYIEQAGGLTQRANKDVIVVLHQNGMFENADDAKLQPGDEIFVLPKIEAKNIEIVRGITQILYQIVLSAKVILLW
ncbi:MAG TPA: polysaccharide biosynthesis/export family protein [Thermodesulfovibrio thiophilus]|nr:polysaccharide biosynthesis/export family protein [Thermodesulfovibrio thiophilus]